MAVNDVQIFSTMVESFKAILNILAKYMELEAKVLLRKMILFNQISAAFVTLYGSALGFLARMAVL